MQEEKKLTAQEAHQFFAGDTNNRTWDLIEKNDRTSDEAVRMIHQSHASAYHWSVAGEPVNLVRAHYLVAKAYFAVEMLEPAVFWAEKAWNSTVELGLDSWDYAFGCEIMARAHAATGNQSGFQDLHAKAVEAIGGLGKQDAALCQGELDRGPWFGMK